MEVVRLTEACGRVLIEKNAYKSVRTITLILLLSNVIDAGHQNNCSVFEMIIRTIPRVCSKLLSS